MSSSYTLVVNPHSGGGAAPGVAVGVARQLREAGRIVRTEYSPSIEGVAPLVQDAIARGDVVVAVGGDGMLSSVAGHVSEAGGTLGLVAAGRGNDFMRMLELPEEAGEQTRVLLEGSERRVDLLEVTTAGRPQVVTSSVYAGVDADGAAMVNRMRYVPGPLQYPISGVVSLATYTPGRYRVVVDGVAREFLASNVVVANSAYYGSGMKVAPQAAIDDGLLDVIVIEAARRFDLLRAFPKVYDGSHIELEQVHHLRGTYVELNGDARKPIQMGADGEELPPLPGTEGAPVTVRILPGALQVIC